MDAKEAQELTETALSKAGAIAPLLAAVYKKIRMAAKEGHRSISHPFHGERMPSMSRHQEEAVLQQLRADGFKVENHTGDPRDPRESDYVTVSW